MDFFIVSIGLVSVIEKDFFMLSIEWADVWYRIGVCVVSHRPMVFNRPRLLYVTEADFFGIAWICV